MYSEYCLKTHTLHALNMDKISLLQTSMYAKLHNFLMSILLFTLNVYTSFFYFNITQFNRINRIFENACTKKIGCGPCRRPFITICKKDSLQTLTDRVCLFGQGGHKGIRLHTTNLKNKITRPFFHKGTGTTKAIFDMIQYQ